jgi:hypothetical protein
MLNQARLPQAVRLQRSVVQAASLLASTVALICHLAGAALQLVALASRARAARAQPRTTRALAAALLGDCGKALPRATLVVTARRSARTHATASFGKATRDKLNSTVLLPFVSTQERGIERHGVPLSPVCWHEGHHRCVTRRRRYEEPNGTTTIQDALPTRCSVKGRARA